MYKCFVVCPFGSETRDAEEKRLFDQLQGLSRYVFKPAVVACRRKGFAVTIRDSRRTDHGCKHIKDAVQTCLDEADVVIVLLSADKPNVYLEMGWAHGLWQDPILLASDKYVVPVDINNDLKLEFTSGHTDGCDQSGARALATQLAGAIIERIKRGRVDKQFEHWPATTLARGAVHVYNRFAKAISPGDWSRMIDSAEREIILASTSMSRILGQAFFTTDEHGRQVSTKLDKFLLKKALDGVSVTVLLYHPENLTLGHLKRHKDDLEEIRRGLQKSFEVWSTQRQIFETLAGPPVSRKGGFRVVQIRRRHLPFRVTLTESRVLATLRLYTEVFNSGLLIDALCPTHRDQENIPVYSQIRDELQYLIEENNEASEDAYRTWAQTRQRA